MGEGEVRCEWLLACLLVLESCRCYIDRLNLLEMFDVIL